MSAVMMGQSWRRSVFGLVGLASWVWLGMSAATAQSHDDGGSAEIIESFPWPMQLSVHAGDDLPPDLDLTLVFMAKRKGPSSPGAACISNFYTDEMYSAANLHWTGDWRFERGGDGCRADRAVRVRWPEAQARYRPIIDVYCRENDTSCETWTEKARTMQAPRPPYSRRSPAYREWRRWVAQELCTMAPPQIHRPHYPPSAVRAGIKGTVYLLLVLNSCGEVRDAMVERMSFDGVELGPVPSASMKEEFARHALSAIRRSRFDASMIVPGEVRFYRVPIKFE